MRYEREKIPLLEKMYSMLRKFFMIFSTAMLIGSYFGLTLGE
jgi:hypothetical protein